MAANSILVTTIMVYHLCKTVEAHHDVEHDTINGAYDKGASIWELGLVES